MVDKEIGGSLSFGKKVDIDAIYKKITNGGHVNRDIVVLVSQILHSECESINNLQPKNRKYSEYLEQRNEILKKLYALLHPEDNNLKNSDDQQTVLVFGHPENKNRFTKLIFDSNTMLVKGLDYTIMDRMHWKANAGYLENPNRFYVHWIPAFPIDRNKDKKGCWNSLSIRYDIVNGEVMGSEYKNHCDSNLNGPKSYGKLLSR